jgi:hypothetical protein
MNMTKGWRRNLWGIEFRSPRGISMLIGTAYHFNHVGEPVSRCLLFTTRKAARTWCNEKQARYSRADFAAKGRCRPVRVIETVRRVRG